MALTLGMTFCHVMELPGKLRLDEAAWLTVQQHLYVAFGIVGAAIELLSILLTWVVAVQVRGRRPAFAWTVTAGLCVTAGLAVWFALVAPVNAALSGWTPATLPADWTRFRDRWEFGHAVHAAPVRAWLRRAGDLVARGNSRQCGQAARAASALELRWYRFGTIAPCDCVTL